MRNHFCESKKVNCAYSVFSTKTIVDIYVLQRCMNSYGLIKKCVNYVPAHSVNNVIAYTIFRHESHQRFWVYK